MCVAGDTLNFRCIKTHLSLLAIIYRLLFTSDFVKTISDKHYYNR